MNCTGELQLNGPPRCCKVEVEVLGSKPLGVKLTDKNINCVKIFNALKIDIQPYIQKIFCSI